MSEWLKEHAWKACLREIVTWVRIPPSPPSYAEGSGWQAILMWYVYVLSSKSDGTLYVGSTNDLKRRLEEHRQGRCESTRLRRPLELEAYVAVKEEGEEGPGAALLAW